MRPPICDLCHRDISPDENGGLVRFKLTPEQEAFNLRFKEPGYVGHPKGLYWFCEKHYPGAQALSHLTSHEAFEQLENSEAEGKSDEE